MTLTSPCRPSYLRSKGWMSKLTVHRVIGHASGSGR